MREFPPNNKVSTPPSSGHHDGIASRAEFDAFAEKHPELYKSLITLLTQRLRETNVAVAAGSFLSLRGRVALTLLELADHFGRNVGSDRIVVQHKIARPLNDAAVMQSDGGVEQIAAERT